MFALLHINYGPLSLTTIIGAALQLLNALQILLIVSVSNIYIDDIIYILDVDFV